VKRRRFIGYAAASAVALTVPWNGLRPVYIHVGYGHVALITRRHWVAGERMLSDNVVWPKVKAGDIAACGACGRKIGSRPGPWVLGAAFA
jgi:hypothetical protein